MKPSSYDEMRRHIERRYSRIFWLIVHITLFAVIANYLWQRDPTPQNGNHQLMMSWFGLVLLHAVKVGMDILKHRELERIGQRYYRISDAEIIEEEKPKRLARLVDENDSDELTHEHNGNGQAHHHDEGRRQKGS